MEFPTPSASETRLTRFTPRTETLIDSPSVFGRYTLALVLTALLVSAISGGLLAAPPPQPAAPPGDPAAALQTLLAQLDSAKFAARERAHARLCQLLEDDAQRPALAAALHQAWLSDQTSVDLRAQLRGLFEQYPQLAPPAPPGNTTVDELTVGIGQLDADSEQVREAALARLRWHLGDAYVATRALAPLKAALASADVSAGTRDVIKTLLSSARSRWLPDAKLDVQLPAVTEADMRGWIACVAAATPESAPDRARQEAARQELLDLLARDAYSVQAAALIAKAREAATDAEGAVRLQELFDWTRPAMAAECWDGGHHKTLQHLLVGVPQVPEGSLRATHFDRIDDHSAHCVSGNSLRPGDYPVGVAIPHPEGTEVVFHLVNLPTPRRRMVFELEVARPEQERFVELSRRTVSAIVAEKRHLGELDVNMLTQLDPETVSAFADKYFEAVPDQPLAKAPEADGPDQGADRPSAHDAVCAVLAKIGTHTAQAALEREAARRPVAADAMPVAWLALLAIAQRDPWPEVDAWLAELVAKEQAFATNTGRRADLGATAAGLLLGRHGVPGEWFELESLDHPGLDALGVTPYRFKQPEKRAEVLRWWRDRRTNRQTAHAR